MPDPVIDAKEWLRQRVPTYTDGEQEIIRWPTIDGNAQEGALDFVADRYGLCIEHAEASGSDVLEVVLAEGPDAGWHDIWRRWRELGYI